MHRGVEVVGRFLLGLRQSVVSEDKPITFSHEGDALIADQEILVHGPRHTVEMTMRARIAFDAEGKIREVSAEPDDVGLFDHVIVTAFTTIS